MLTGILEEEVEARMKEAAIISMGTEISGEDLVGGQYRFLLGLEPWQGRPKQTWTDLP